MEIGARDESFGPLIAVERVVADVEALWFVLEPGFRPGPVDPAGRGRADYGAVGLSGEVSPLLVMRYSPGVTP